MLWYNFIQKEKKKLYFQNIIFFLKQEFKSKKIIFPSKENRFLAFSQTSFNKVKVVILGQDPYHGENQAHGLCFSVLNDKTPPSLNNIFKELKNDLNIVVHNNNLTKWSSDGVLMLNAILTVEKDKPLSHSNIGWEIFTKNVFQILQKKEKVVYILWGKFAQTYEKYIIKNKNYIIKSSHPSPFSANRGFFNSKPFSRTNNFLISQGIQPIDWTN